MAKPIKAAFFIAVSLMMCLSGCDRAGDSNRGTPSQITVSAAMSMKDAVGKIKRNHPHGSALNLNFGASGALQHQIEQGAPVDVFISAGQKQMDDLQEKGLIDPETRVNLLSNEIVLVSPAGTDAVRDFKDLLKPEVSTIAVADPKVAPAGEYARETLLSIGLWEALQPKIILCKDVRQVLHYVESANVDAGMVFASDAVSAKRARVAAKAKTSQHSQIAYPAAVVSHSREKQAALDFLHYLKGPEAMSVFLEFGFTRCSEK